MQKIILSILAIMMLFGCAPKAKPILPDKEIHINSVDKKYWTAGYLPLSTKPQIIIGTVPNAPSVINGYKDLTIIANFDSRKDAINAVYAWLREDNPNDFIKQSEISLRKYRITDPDHKKIIIDEVKKLNILNDYYLYILTEKYKILEIKGLDDYAAIMKAVDSNLPIEKESGVIRDTINWLAIMDIASWGQGGIKGSRYISHALSIPAPFFVTLDNAIWIFEEIHKAYKRKVHRDRAVETMAKAPTLKDKCALVLSEPGFLFVRDVTDVRKQAMDACRQWEPESQADKVIKAKSVFYIAQIDLLRASKEGFWADVTIDELEKAYSTGVETARTGVERNDIDRLYNFLKALWKFAHKKQ